MEFITNRNSTELLEDYASWLEQKGFVVSLGSEHNTPDLLPVKLFTGGGIDLSRIFKVINYRGVCIIAAHQYLKASGSHGYLQDDASQGIGERDNFITLGNTLIREFVTN